MQVQRFLMLLRRKANSPNIKALEQTSCAGDSGLGKPTAVCQMLALDHLPAVPRRGARNSSVVSRLPAFSVAYRMQLWEAAPCFRKGNEVIDLTFLICGACAHDMAHMWRREDSLFPHLPPWPQRHGSLSLLFAEVYEG